MKKKLCYILPDYDEAISGHYYYLYRLLEGLSNKAELFLIIERCHGRPNFPFAEKIYIAHFRFPYLKWLEIILYLIYIRLRGCRTFYSHYSFYGALTTALITRIMGGKSCLWMSIMLKEFSTDKTRRLRQFHKLLIFKYKVLYRFIHYLVTSSPFMADYYAAHLGISRDKIVVIPNWVDLNRFDSTLYQRQKVRKELGLPLEKLIVLFVHGLEYGKGANDLPEIIDGVTSERSELVFVIVGDGQQKNWLEQKIRDKELDKVAILTGAIPQRDIPKYYAAADLFILPSRYEEFSRVLLEAMAMGIPFVTTDGCGGATKAYTSNKQQEYMAEAGDITKFNQMLIQLTDDKKQRCLLAKEGLAFVKSYSESVAINNFMNKIVNMRN